MGWEILAVLLVGLVISPFPATDDIMILVIVWRTTAKIIRTAFIVTYVHLQ